MVGWLIAFGRFSRGLLLVALLTLVTAHASATWALRLAPGYGPTAATTPVASLLPDLPDRHVDLPSLPLPPERDVIYLNREGATLTAGPDDSSNNTSSLVAARGLQTLEVPAFRGSAKRWDGIVRCVRDRFGEYDVDIVDRRPVDGRYIMVMVGGEAGPMAETSLPGVTSGLAPRASRPLYDAVAYVFARSLKESTRKTCETIVHEVGHAYGLDHSRVCEDPMSYRTGCGAKSFQDVEGACGEGDERACADGLPTQNSHRHLLGIVGAAVGGEA